MLKPGGPAFRAWPEGRGARLVHESKIVGAGVTSADGY